MSHLISRRTLLKGSLGLAASVGSLVTSGKVFAAEVSALPKALTGDAVSNAKNEKYWHQIANQFKLSPDFINLENGYYGILPKPVYQ